MSVMRAAYFFLRALSSKPVNLVCHSFKLREAITTGAAPAATSFKLKKLPNMLLNTLGVIRTNHLASRAYRPSSAIPRQPPIACGQKPSVSSSAWCLQIVRYCRLDTHAVARLKPQGTGLVGNGSRRLATRTLPADLRRVRLRDSTLALSGLARRSLGAKQTLISAIVRQQFLD
jgi:hypothetical protein